MRTAIFTLDTTPNVERPVDSPRGPEAGFRLTITRPDESVATFPPIVQTTLRVGNFIPGGSYTVRFEVVDDTGAVIQALPDQTLVVPAAEPPPPPPPLTYTRLNGFTVAWE